MAEDKSNSVSGPKSSKDAEFKVVSPLGEVVVKETPMAPRPDTLEGKTVCLTWNASFRANVTLSAIADLLQKKYPKVKVISYTEMPESFKAPPPGTTTPEREALVAAFKKADCDAIISGNGG
jgi:hypothetical protein